MADADRRYGRADLLDTDETLLVEGLSVRDGDYFTTEANAPGPFQITLADDDESDAVEATEDRLVRFYVTDNDGDYVPIVTSVIERPNITVLSTKPSDRGRTIIGRDWVMEFDDVLVDPPLGMDSVPVANSIQFDWTLAWLLPAADLALWDAPYCLGSVFTADTDPFGDVFSGTWYGGVGGRNGWSPAGWPDTFTGWMWGSLLDGSNNRPAGEVCYFLLPLDLTEGPFLPISTSDNTGKLAFDGAVIDEGALPPAAQWETCTASGITEVSAGTHYICARAQNDPGGAANNPAGFAFVGYQAVLDKYLRFENVIARTGGTPLAQNVGSDPVYGGGWLCWLDTLDNQPPGFTPGHAWRILFDAAQASGHLVGWTLGFSDTLDSNGNPWVKTDALTARVNDDTLLAVATAWADGGFWEFWAAPDARVFHACQWGERGAIGGASLTWDGDYVTKIVVEGKR